MTVFVLVASLTAFANEIGRARLSLIKGDVLVLTPDTGDEWFAASVNLPLLSGDRIWVPPDGRAEIQFIGRTYLRAEENTEVSIVRSVWDSDSRVIQVRVPEGRVYINYRVPAGRDSVFQVDAPLVSVTAYDHARYDIQVRDDGYSEVSVYSGSVYVESPSGRIKVARGNMISIGSDDYAEIFPLGQRSEWVRWNESRDSLVSRYRESSRYLPAELDVYSSDLDEYGTWIYVRDYGYAWRPTVVVSGWAPYRHGRWVWLRGDYVWISYDPWGWAPHHYGRWAFRIGIGWFWVPPAVGAVYWSPGFVAWIYTPTYVSWVPLAPREIYYGYGYYGPYSVNLTKVNVKNITVTNVYVNSRVNNAVTIVHRDTFLTGRQKKSDTGPLVNPFTHGARVSPGRPDIKPVKVTAMPLPDKAVPEKSLPPPRVGEKIKTKDMDQRRIAAKPEESVFSGERVAPLHVIEADKPRRAIKSDRKKINGPSPLRESPGRLQSAPSESRRPVVDETVEKGRMGEQKEMRARLVVTPREYSDSGKIKERETERRPAIEPRGLERRSVVPREYSGERTNQRKAPEGGAQEIRKKGSVSPTARNGYEQTPVKPDGANIPLLKKPKGPEDKPFFEERRNPSK